MVNVYNEAYTKVVTLLNPLFANINEVRSEAIRANIEIVRTEYVQGGADVLSKAEWDRLFADLIKERSEAIKNRPTGSPMTMLKWKKKPNT